MCVFEKNCKYPANLFCKFCKSVGHEEKYCRAYQLLKEKIVDTYLMKNEGFPQVGQVQALYQPAQFLANKYQQLYVLQQPSHKNPYQQNYQEN